MHLNVQFTLMKQHTDSLNVNAQKTCTLNDSFTVN